MRIPNRLAALADVKSAWERLANECHVPEAAAADMLVALDEILSNLIHYAFEDNRAHEIEVYLGAGPSRIECTVEDDGVAFDPLASPAPDLQAPVEAWPIGGLGIHLVRQLMTEVHYQRVAGRNCLHLVRLLGE